MIGPDRIVSETGPLKVALVGNPNSGKSSLFNALTGLNQQIGNFPGVTVEKRTGKARLSDGREVEVMDLPGTYSLFPKSMDEELAVSVLTDPTHEDFPDITLVVADASNLKRSLFLCTQVMDLRVPVVLVLNMVDLAQRKGLEISAAALEHELGVPVVPMNARKGEGIEALRAALAAKGGTAQGSIVDMDRIETRTIRDIERVLRTNCAFASFIVANNLHNISYFNHNREKREAIRDILELNQFDARKLQALESIERYRKLSEIVGKVIRRVAAAPAREQPFDRILTHRIWGYGIFLLVLFLVFQAIFTFSSWPMAVIEDGFSMATAWLSERLPAGLFTDLLLNGVMAGLSGVVVFVPQIALLFAFIAILEDSGYMARVSFLMDRLLRPVGLNGRSIIPLISGVACAVPAIMGTRTIANWKERTITLLVTPLMSCSARLPVYTLLISLMIPPGKMVWGVLSMQGLLLMALYMLGFVAALGAALVLKLILKTREKSYFIMELPLYRAPRWRNVGLTILEKVKVFLHDAGKVILAIAIVLWALSRFGPSERRQNLEQQMAAELRAHPTDSLSIVRQYESLRLETSYAGILGKAIEPAIRPLGFDWKMGISLITSFAAREVFVGTMATLYSVGDAEDTRSIREKMQEARNPVTLKPVYSPAVCFSLILFYAFALQCMSTLAVVKRETGSWKWPLVQFLGMGALAWLASFCCFQLWP